MYYSVYYIKNCPVTPKIAPKIALKHNAESAIIITCEVTINNLSHVRLSFLTVAESSIKHCSLYNNKVHYLMTMTSNNIKNFINHYLLFVR